MNSTEVVRSAKVLWDYLSSYRDERESDAIVVCCSYDLRVMDHAVELLDRGLSDRMVITGNSGHWTEHLWVEPEARVFYEYAKSRIPARIEVNLETEATNFGENIRFSAKLLPDIKSTLILTKPNAVLRVLLTVRKQWPAVESCVSSPAYQFPEHASNVVGFFGVINEMIGDIDRIKRYPAMGFQVEHDLPAKVIEASEFLIDQGFDQHLAR